MLKAIAEANSEIPVDYFQIQRTSRVQKQTSIAMGRKLNLSHLTEEECERILHVLQKDFEVRQAEKDRIG